MNLPRWMKTKRENVIEERRQVGVQYGLGYADGFNEAALLLIKENRSLTKINATLCTSIKYIQSELKGRKGE